jgi:hypothetical protein
MCIIIYSKNGRIPENHLGCSLENNPDGWGFMVGTGEYLHVSKGMRTKRFWRAWDNRPSGPVVFHARIATHGTTGIENCHPFWVDNHLAVAHNGIISAVREDPVLSDTRVFIRDVLRELPDDFLENKAMRRLIAEFIGRSKLAFMNAQGRCWILNRGLGLEIGNRWYSNDGYLSRRRFIIAAPKAVTVTQSTTFAPLNDVDRRLPEYYRTLTRPTMFNPYVR